MPEVFWENGQWWIRDLDSRNGTYPDGNARNQACTSPQQGKFELAVNGPVVELEIEQVRRRALPFLKQSHIRPA